jgi:tRNA-2-methylthio-N6-dimethylallyladenosine synthase
MNVHDSEKALAVLAPLGYRETTSLDEADLVLLNTCSVREKASEKVYHRVASIRHITSPRTPPIGILGCVAQAEADALFERSPAVRIVVGPQALEALPDLVRQLEAGFPHAIDLRQDNRPDFIEVEAADRRSGAVAYVTIIEGCNKNCSYCIVPYTRGRERSRPADSIVAEVRRLGEAGFHEVQLLGQNVNSYADWVVKPSGRRFAQNAFPYLLERVAREGGVGRIKFTTSHPRDFDEKIVRVMDDYEQLCNWIHLPVQSGSNRVLRAMQRGYTRESYLRKIEHVKRARRDYSLTSDIIVGFPGETERDFQQTLDLVRAVEFDGLYTFHYSPRPHTPASKLADDVSPEERRARMDELLAVQAEIQKRRYRRYLGTIVEVLVDKASARHNGDLSGHTACNKVVNFPAEDRSLIGALVRVEVTATKPHSLYGKLV